MAWCLKVISARKYETPGKKEDSEIQVIYLYWWKIKIKKSNDLMTAWSHWDNSVWFLESRFVTPTSLHWSI